MNAEHKILAEKVIDFFKEYNKDIFPWDDLSHIIKDQNTMKSIFDSLVNDFGFIEKSGKHTFRLTKKGWDFNSFSDLENKQLEFAKKEQIEFKKTQVDLELAEKMLKEYPKTKWFARFGFVISGILAIVQLIQWIMQLQSQ